MDPNHARKISESQAVAAANSLLKLLMDTNEISANVKVDRYQVRGFRLLYFEGIIKRNFKKGTYLLTQAGEAHIRRHGANLYPPSS